MPSIPVSEYIFDNVIPATAVGSANGSSISPSSTLFPAKSYLTNVHAIIVPNTQLITAAMNEHPMLVTKELTTFCLVTSLINSAGGSLSEYTITEASGINTISDNIVTVIPSVK